MVEHLTCNQTVVGSIPTTSSIFYGKFAERPNATDCKSVDFVFGGSNPPLPTKKIIDQTDVWSIFFCKWYGFKPPVCEFVPVGT